MNASLLEKYKQQVTNIMGDTTEKFDGIIFLSYECMYVISRDVAYSYDEHKNCINTINGIGGSSFIVSCKLKHPDGLWTLQENLPTVNIYYPPRCKNAWVFCATILFMLTLLYG